MGLELTGDTEIYSVDMNGNHVTVSLKGALYIPSYSLDVYIFKFATAKEAIIIFNKDKNKLVHRNITKFNIYIYIYIYIYICVSTIGYLIQ